MAVLDRPQGRNSVTSPPRGAGVAYVSAPRRFRGSPRTLTWTGRTPGRTSLAFEIRVSPTREGLAAQPWSRPFDHAPADLAGLALPSDGWIQCRANFITPDGGQSPSLTEARITFE